jgi:exodeoxyribonuclease VII large subunit
MSRLESSPEEPVPLRRVSMAIANWIGRLGEIWVEGQVAQISRRPGMGTQFLVLRDPDANVSMGVTATAAILDSAQITEGSRVVLRARPDFYAERGTLQLRATEARQVGLGHLLARLEQLKKLLAAEGLFNPSRKKALPFLPHQIGLITGRASAAERDVVENARRRLPGVRFEIANVATQGVNAVTEIVDALARFDTRSDIDLIVIARGGGSVEDLLPFSNETLIRAVAACRTPVVSAIGHETDTPLLDLVADLAASTPTDAAKRIVPDLQVELEALREVRARTRRLVVTRLEREVELVSSAPARMRASLQNGLQRAETDAATTRARIRARMGHLLDAAREDVTHLHARAVSLSPQATLDRGYAVVQTRSGAVVRNAEQANDEPTGLRIRVAAGEFTADVTPDVVPRP